MGKAKSENNEELVDAFLHKEFYFVVTPLLEDLNLNVVIRNVKDGSSFDFCRFILFSVVKAV